ncbi:hypothetical protein [Acidocella sp.]|uniref:hypothetical protein n=1 Tax=Acidocella sp. TaxID=50710 RepID=UPI0026072C9B|nr:hypothetical protein [Acidocella sp.]
MNLNKSVFAFIGILGLSGCQGAFNPFNRPGTWSETGAANEALAQQVAQKSDLISGQSEQGSNGIAAVSGIEKAMTGGTATGLQTTLTPATITTSTGSN